MSSTPTGNGSGEPLVIEKPAADRVAGALIYGIGTLLIAPMSALLVGPLCAGGLGALLGVDAKGPDLPTGLLLVVVGASAFLGTLVAVARAGWRRWKLGAGRFVRVFSDRIERDGEAWPFAEVTHFRVMRIAGHPHAIELGTRDGRRVELRKGHWDIDAILARLRETLFPVLAKSLRASLRAGDTVTCQEPLGAAIAMGALGALLAAWGVLLLGILVFNFTQGKLETSPNGLRAGYYGFLFGIGGTLTLWRSFAVRGGGLVLGPGGVRARKDAPEIPWRDVVTTDTGDRIEITGGNVKAKLTSSGAHFDVLVDLLREIARDGRP